MAFLLSPLRLARVTRGLTLADVAKSAPVSSGQLSKIERGLAQPCDELRRALEALYSGQPAQSESRGR